MTTGPDYRLDFDNPKKNVFVTQLHTRDDEDDDLQQFPVVQESAGALLESGLNTLQKTLLLKKEVEVDRVNDELRDKRADFRRRMEACAEKQMDIQKRQQAMKARTSKFDKFIKDNEMKRRRAIQKYQTEVKLKEQRSREYDLICAQLEELKKRHEHLKYKLENYKIFEEYLNRVVDILPAHYLEVNESMLSSLMMRHRTLSATNVTLVENLATMVDETERLKHEYKELKQEHSKKIVSDNSSLSSMQKEQEHCLNRNQEQEQRLGLGQVEFRHQLTEFGRIMMAINNIADKCHRHTDAALDDMKLDKKLHMIKDYMVERLGIARLARIASSQQSSERRNQSLRDVYQV